MVMTNENIINRVTSKHLFLQKPELWILIDMSKYLLQSIQGSGGFQPFLEKVSRKVTCLPPVV